MTYLVLIPQIGNRFGLGFDQDRQTGVVPTTIFPACPLPPDLMDLDNDFVTEPLPGSSLSPSALSFPFFGQAGTAEEALGSDEDQEDDLHLESRLNQMTWGCEPCLGSREGGGGDPGGGPGAGEGFAAAHLRKCPRGGCAARSRRAAKARTRAQTRQANRLGPEGLGDQNDVDVVDEDNGEVEEEEMVEVIEGCAELPVPVSEEPILSDHARNIVSALAAVARDCLMSSADSGIVSNVHKVIQALQGSSADLESPPLALETGPQDGVIFLAALVKRCQKAEVFEACAQFNYWVNVFTFACQMNQWATLFPLLGLFPVLLTLASFREMASTRDAKYKIFNRIVDELKKSSTQEIKHSRTLDRYFQDGLTIASLCGAGSFYMLILIACSRLRPELRKLNGTMCGRVAKLIRCPPGKCLDRLLFILLTPHRVCCRSTGDKISYSCNCTPSSTVPYQPENDSSPRQLQAWPAC